MLYVWHPPLSILLKKQAKPIYKDIGAWLKLLGKKQESHYKSSNRYNIWHFNLTLCFGGSQFNAIFIHLVPGIVGSLLEIWTNGHFPKQYEVIKEGIFIILQ